MDPSRLRSFLATGAMILTLAAQQARADSLTLTFAGDTGALVNYTATVNGTTYSSPTGGTNPQSTETGPYFFHVSGGSQISTFCIDVTRNVGSAGQAYTVSTLNSVTGSQALSNAITALYGMYYDYNSTTGKNNANWSTLSGAQAANSADYTAFQLALWELIYDGTADISNPTSSSFFSSGNFTSTDPAAGEAQSMLTNALENTAAGDAAFSSGLGANYSLVALTNPTDQTLLYLQPGTPTPQMVQTPAPPALLLVGFGLAAMLGRARLTRRTPPPAVA